MPVLLEKKTDREIQLDVLAEFERDPRYRPAELGVEVDDGVVTLVGTVSTFTKLIDGGDIAARVAGVRNVANKLTVEMSPNTATDDTALAKRARTALEWAQDVPDERLDLIVRNGLVTLTGTLDHWYERIAAVDAVKRIAGVVSVIDRMILEAEPREDREIHDDLKAAFRRRMPWAADHIDVTVDDGVVTLMGRVGSYLNAREAEEIAWSASGVKDVARRLEVRI